LRCHASGESEWAWAWALGLARARCRSAVVSRRAVLAPRLRPDQANKQDTRYHNGGVEPPSCTPTNTAVRWWWK